MNKIELAILLSKLKTFNKSKLNEEQYATDSQTAADLLWHAFLLEDIKKKKIADLGCGTGILGLGALILGAEKCYFIDSDSEALCIAKENLKFIENKLNIDLKGKVIFIHSDISKFSEKVDTVIENPPFGTKEEHADRAFLEKSIESANIVYSFHKTSTLSYLSRFITIRKGKITHFFRYQFPLKQTMFFHRAKIKRIDVTCLRIQKL